MPQQMVTRRHAHRTHRVIVVVMAALAAVVWVLPAGPAAAHAQLVSTSPLNGARLAQAPTEVTLSFTEPVTPTGIGIQVFDAAGQRVDNGDAANVDGDPSSVRVGLVSGLADDGYLVSWRVLSADTHPIFGAFTFTVGDGSAVDPNAVPGVSDGGDDPLVGFAVDANRWMGYIGVALFLGGLAFVGLCWSAGRGDRRTGRLVFAGWLLATVSAVLALLLYGPYSQGLGLLDAFDPSALGTTLGEPFGRATAGRAVLLLVAAGFARWIWRGGGAEVWLAWGLVMAAALLTYGLGGHPSTGIQPWLAVPSDALHLAAMSVWLGGLVLLFARVLRPSGGNESAVTAAVPRFSTVAMVCVGVLVVTGTYQSWRGLGSFGALFGTDYGKLVVAKIVGILTLIVLGWLAQRWLRRRAAATSASARPAVAALRRGVLLEMGVIAVVLGLSAVLVGTPPGRVTYVDPFRATLALPAGGSIEVSLDPAAVGTNRLDVTVLDGAGAERDVPEVRASLSLPDKGIGPLPVELNRVAPGLFVNESADLPAPGQWQLTINVRTTEFDISAATTTFTVD